MAVMLSYWEKICDNVFAGGKNKEAVHEGLSEGDTVALSEDGQADRGHRADRGGEGAGVVQRRGMRGAVCEKAARLHLCAGRAALSQTADG